MIALSAAFLYFAMSLPANAPLQWWGPLSRAECRIIQQKTSGIWCQPIRIRK